MTEAERDQFVSQPSTAVLATALPNGRVHAVPVWYLYTTGEQFQIITERGSQKHRNAARSGRATLCIDERGGSFRHVTAEGPVEVVDPVTYDQRLALHRHYRGEEAARAIVDAGGHEHMVLLVLTPERWY